MGSAIFFVEKVVFVKHPIDHLFPRRPLQPARTVSLVIPLVLKGGGEGEGGCPDEILLCSLNHQVRNSTFPFFSARASLPLPPLPITSARSTRLYADFS